MPTILTAGDAVSAASSFAGANDGALNIVVGPAGGKLTALTIDAAGKVALPQGSGGGFLTLGTVQASTSGTSIDFTGIPSWVKRVTMAFSAVGITSAGVGACIQLGTASSIETTGYSGGEATATGGTSAQNSSAFVIKTNMATGSTLSGFITLVLMDASTNTWAQSGVTALGNTTQTSLSAGSKSLAGTLTRLRLTTVSGTDVFAAGKVNILYEG